MAAWWGVYLPWVFVAEYYLLPFTLGAAWLTGNLVAEHVTLIRQGGPGYKLFAGGALAVAAFFFALTLPNNWSNANLQLATDAANADMVRYVTQNVPPDRVVLLNIQEPNEYVPQITWWITLVEGRGDLQVGYFHGQNLAEEGWREVYLLLPVIENQFYPSVRTGISEFSARQWNQVLAEHFGALGELVYETHHRRPILTVNALWLFCPLARPFGYCEYIQSAFNRQEFSFGWQIYRLTAP
jgi:hypothetical protein